MLAKSENEGSNIGQRASDAKKDGGMQVCVRRTCNFKFYFPVLNPFIFLNVCSIRGKPTSQKWDSPKPSW